MCAPFSFFNFFFSPLISFAFLSRLVSLVLLLSFKALGVKCCVFFFPLSLSHRHLRDLVSPPSGPTGLFSVQCCLPFLISQAPAISDSSIPDSWSPSSTCLQLFVLDLLPFGSEPVLLLSDALLSPYPGAIPQRHRFVHVLRLVSQATAS